MKLNHIVKAVICIVLATAALALTPKKSTDLKYNLTHLSGTYADPAPYNYGKAWGKRVFTFDKGKWSLVFTLALDPSLTMQVFQFRTFGTYKLGEKSSTNDNTYEAVFYETKKYITLKTGDKNLMKAFGFTPCNVSINVEQDISASGCSAWKSVKECPGDHDLLSLDKEGKLYFGERPADNNMCTPDKRPTKLTPPVIKQ